MPYSVDEIIQALILDFLGIFFLSKWIFLGWNENPNGCIQTVIFTNSLDFSFKTFLQIGLLISGVYAGMVCFSYDGIVGQFIDVQCISDTQLQGGEHQGANRSPLCG